MVVKTDSTLSMRDEIQSFLEEFCTKDRMSISRTVHKTMMISCFYYVDYESQGWYVLDNSENFHRELDGDDYWIYGEMYQGATAYE